MRPSLLPLLHGAAGVLAFCIILAFWSSTVLVELFGDAAAVAQVKTGIAWGLLALVPALAATGASGYAIAGPNPRGLAGTKFGRMRVIGANGLLVLAPAALFLAWKANAGAFDRCFAAAQAAELFAGLVNLGLMGLNIRDGLRMSGRFGRNPRTAEPTGSVAA